MKITIDLGQLFDEEERGEMTTYGQELARCKGELIALIPNIKEMSDMELENLLETGQPGLVGQLIPLLRTMTVDRNELAIFVEVVREDYLPKNLNVLIEKAAGGELTAAAVDTSAVEERLSKILERIPLVTIGSARVYKCDPTLPEGHDHDQEGCEMGCEPLVVSQKQAERIAASASTQSR